MYIKMLKGSKCSLDGLRSWLAPFLVVNCLVTFMALINKICEQISLIDAVQGVAVARFYGGGDSGAQPEQH